MDSCTKAKTDAESNTDVFFDNLQVVHNRGPLLEETHYYPFGLTMAGISSKAAGKTENKKKFQGQEFAHGEFSDGSGLEMYEFKWRMDDPQTGRFWQVDPLSDKYVYNSTYAFSENKVTSHVELEGLEAVESNSILYSQNGQSKVLYSSTSKVDNPYQLGGGKLSHVTTIEVSKDGSQTIRKTELYEPTLGQKILNFLKGAGQLQIYGSGDGSDGPGGKPDYTKPIGSIDMEEVGPLLDLIASGGSAKPSLSRPSVDEAPDFAKVLMDAVSDATKGQSGRSNTDGGKSSSKETSSTSKRPSPVKYYYDGTSAKKEKGFGQGERTSNDPSKPDTILYEKNNK